MPHISKIFQGGHTHHPPTTIYPSRGELRPRRGDDSQESVRGLLFSMGSLDSLRIRRWTFLGGEFCAFVTVLEKGENMREPARGPGARENQHP